jgi:hypothetical protein
VEYAGDGFAREQIVTEIGVNMGGNNDEFAEWSRCVIGYIFGGFFVF